jgi:hypothetical protein
LGSPKPKTKNELADAYARALQRQDIREIEPFIMTETEMACMPSGDLHQSHMPYSVYRQLLSDTFARVLQTGRVEHHIVWNKIRVVAKEKSGNTLWVVFSSEGETFRSKLDDAYPIRDRWLVGDYFGALQHIDLPTGQRALSPEE